MFDQATKFKALIFFTFFTIIMANIHDNGISIVLMASGDYKEFYNEIRALRRYVVSDIIR